MAGGGEHRPYAGEAPAATRVSIIAVGAIAAALAVICAVLAPFARVESATMRVARARRPSGSPRP